MEHKSNNLNPTSATEESAVSNIPTATPIASEIITDFEPDPKFEITPLEKATFDCNDIFIQDASVTTDYVQQPESNGKTNLESESQDSVNVYVAQDSGVLQLSSEEKGSKPQQVESSNATKPEVEVKSTEPAKEPPQDPLQTTAAIAPNHASSKINDCLQHSEKLESDAEHLTATISVEESIAASALVQVAEGQTTKPSTVENPKDESNANRQQQQYSAIDTQQQAGRAHTNEENEHANYLFSLSQTSADAQMEKVVEKIVELGEGHEFSHSLSQVEDREKLLESIQRDMTGVQSSIELIADVASKQQSIEIKVADPEPQQKVSDDPEPTKQVDLVSSNQDQTQDLKPSAASPADENEGPNAEKPIEKVQYGDETAAEKSPVPMDESETGVALGDDEVEVPETEETTEVVEQNEPTKLSEAQVEPIIEEPPVLDETVADKIAEEPKEGDAALADVIVEPIESADEVAETLNLEPIVEEASSADEQEQAETNTIESIPNENSSKIIAETLPEETRDQPQVDVAKIENEVVEKMSPVAETGRRKSGRKPKVTKGPVEESSIEESRRSSRRVLSRKQRASDEPSDVKEDVTMPQKAIDHELATKETDEGEGDVVRDNPVNEEETKDELKDVIEDVPFQDTEMKLDPKDTSHEKEAAKPSEKSDPVEQKAESNRRPSRQLRVRAPKRPHEEVEEAESPQPEPPKKQVKRSRGSADELNKSSVPTRSTPSIKLPSLKSRMTISTSDPSSRPGAHKERGTTSPQLPSNKQYVCNQCGFATDRLNNIVYHQTKSYCKGKSAIAEMMKNSIIQQQQSKSKRKHLR